jgi:hemerythrin-like domain-containing protein
MVDARSVMTMATLAGVIRAGLEHDALEPLLREADKLANHLAGEPGPGSIRRVGAVVAALVPELIHHLDLEEQEVYPIVFGDDLRCAVDLLVLDHAAIRTAARRLERAYEMVRSRRFEEREPVRRALIELVALVRSHNAKESFLYVRTVTDTDPNEDRAAG